MIGHDLSGEWAGVRAEHCGRDRYRILWEELPAEEDYEGDENDEVTPVVVLRVGEKGDRRPRTIYEEGRPNPY